MNRGKGEWWDWTYNPVTGCNRGCDYCYARARWKLSFEEKHGPFKPMVWRERFEEPCRKKTPAVIFTVSMGDFFDPGFCDGERDEVLCMMGECDRHQYVILTKNEKGLLRYGQYLDTHDEGWPPNLWVGVSVTRAREVSRIHALRAAVPKGRRIVCFEPLLEPIEPDLRGIDWIMVGGMTGRQKFSPPTDWIRNIVLARRQKETAVWIKRNANAPAYLAEIRHLPHEMRAGLRAVLRQKLREGR